MELLYKLEQHSIELVKLSRLIVELSRDMEAIWQQQHYNMATTNLRHHQRCIGTIKNRIGMGQSFRCGYMAMILLVLPRQPVFSHVSQPVLLFWMLRLVRIKSFN